ncbi:MAG: DegT/DnrJ/EryC1/StrS family aminotransferase [Clostridia bacterium]|nr:DegT/DnrJ/EryC1/StrS family aminotransferase [Clostridia bacterium]
MAKLALFGGTPVRTSPLPAFPEFGAPEEKAILRAAEITDPASDTERRVLEEAYCRFSGIPYTFAVTNGTVTLEMILRTLGIGRGDEVILPSYTFIATVSSVLFAGATPVFCDIEPDTFDLSAAAVEAKITERTRAVIPVYIGGRPADLDAFVPLCKKHGLYLIEDAAQAVGATWRDEPVGSFGEFGSVSCQASKNLTCGEGGLVLTASEENARRFEPFYRGERGTGAPLNEMGSALLAAQLTRLNYQMQIREANARLLDQRLSPLGFVSPMAEDERITRHGLHLYLFRYFEEQMDGISRETFLKALAAEGYSAAAGYSRPCHRSPILQSDYVRRIAPTLDLSDEGLSETVRAAEKTGAWFYQSLLLGSRADTERMADAFEKIYENRDELRKEIL